MQSQALLWCLKPELDLTEDAHTVIELYCHSIAHDCTRCRLAVNLRCKVYIGKMKRRAVKRAKCTICA